MLFADVIWPIDQTSITQMANHAGKLLSHRTEDVQSPPRTQEVHIGFSKMHDLFLAPSDSHSNDFLKFGQCPETTTKHHGRALSIALGTTSFDIEDKIFGPHAGDGTSFSGPDPS